MDLSALIQLLNDRIESGGGPVYQEWLDYVRSGKMRHLYEDVEFDDEATYNAAVNMWQQEKSRTWRDNNWARDKPFVYKIPEPKPPRPSPDLKARMDRAWEEKLDKWVHPDHGVMQRSAKDQAQIISSFVDPIWESAAKVVESVPTFGVAPSNVTNNGVDRVSTDVDRRPGPM